ncbi:MAG TPA: 6-phosphogluconolactonase [Gammaproteobacteria bacterium]
MSPAALRWHLYPDAERLAEGLAAALAIRAEECLTMRGRYLIVLTGGETPRLLYRRLAAIDTDWPRWHVYFCDERCVPAGHRERNDAMARGEWLDHVQIPPANVHAIPGELGPERAADAYCRVLDGVGPFDTTLLGLGEDGHAASLFPGRPDGLAADAPDAIPVRASPKPPPERVSLSARRLKASREVVFVVAGAEKRDAVGRLARLDPAIPASAVVPPAGADVWLDDAAASDIRSEVRSDTRSL